MEEVASEKPEFTNYGVVRKCERVGAEGEPDGPVAAYNGHFVIALNPKRGIVAGPELTFPVQAGDRIAMQVQTIYQLEENASCWEGALAYLASFFLHTNPSGGDGSGPDLSILTAGLLYR
ncbi:hypothetical protein SAMN05421823_104491 [Catalinimonas alkaloidigena]|uniref:Uncharacterized protein n=2 Tax=Catalinimonas alkaloidigena TaxID=1075417 RepID=A0A1G9HNS6_9BACT|nr:hypothetical protein SAMN05421823_104491 [Catalinimonas alkaloidigena]